MSKFSIREKLSTGNREKLGLSLPYPYLYSVLERSKIREDRTHTTHVCSVLRLPDFRIGLVRSYLEIIDLI